MSDLNQCSFIGRLGKDVEVKSFQGGGKICNFSIAVGENWKDKATGERKERTEWVNVTINNDGLIGVAEKYLRKGSKVFIQGQMRTRKYQDRDGNDKYATEIMLGFNAILQMLDGKPADSGDTRQQERQARPAQSNAFPDDLDDEVPF